MDEDLILDSKHLDLSHIVFVLFKSLRSLGQLLTKTKIYLKTAARCMAH